jgi:hypothetical protein
MKAFYCAAAVLVCLVLSALPRATGADDQAKKWLIGRWAPIPENKPEPASAKPAKTKAKSKSRTKKAAAARKVVEELPKCVIEFTKDGVIRLDGETSAVGSNFRFIKPLADVAIRVSPETRNIKITYDFKDDKSIEISADHTWLLEKLSAGGAAELPPEKAKQLLEEYRPKETLRFAASGKTLTLTNAQGQSLPLRRYTGGTLEAEESRRRQADMKSGLDPFRDILKKQGINVGGPKQGNPPAKSQ